MKIGILFIALLFQGFAMGSPDEHPEKKLSAYCRGACTQENDPHLCRTAELGEVKGGNLCDSLTRLCRLAEKMKLSPDVLHYSCHRSKVEDADEEEI